MRSVHLICMPWMTVDMPSIQLSMLQAAAIEEGFEVNCHHLNLRFASKIGWEPYSWFSNRYMMCDLISQGLLFEDAEIQKADEIGGEVLEEHFPNLIDDGIDFIQHLRNEMTSCVQEFLDDFLSVYSPWLIGFTINGMQLLPSIYLAKKIKIENPNTIIIFGGVYCSGILGDNILGNFKCVDAVVKGEGEDAFVQILRCGQVTSDIKGVFTRTCKKKQELGKIENLDKLPIPNYGPYIDYALKLSFPFQQLSLPIEFGRGCWWNRCTFCNYTLQSPQYRLKSQARIHQEFSYFLSSTNIRKFQVVDAIQPPRIDNIIEAMRDYHGIEFSMAVRANLTYEELKRLYSVGLRNIHFGVESFSPRLLRVMDKGISVAKILFILLWCRELGIECHYNLITNFPGETKEDRNIILDIINKISGLFLPEFSPFSLNVGSRIEQNPKKYSIIPHRNVLHEKLYHSSIIHLFDYYKDYSPMPSGSEWWEITREKVEEMKEEVSPYLQKIKHEHLRFHNMDGKLIDITGTEATFLEQCGIKPIKVDNLCEIQYLINLKLIHVTEKGAVRIVPIIE